MRDPLLAQNHAHRVRYAREASYVERTHTRPKIGSYNNGFHTYNMLAMLLILHPFPSLALIRHITFHDTAERSMGDAPWEGKRRHEGFRYEYELGEKIEMEHRGFDLPSLSHEDLRWFKALDLVEFYFWGLDQQLLGSQVFDIDIKNLEESMAARDLPEEVREMVDVYFKRLKEEGWHD